MGFMYGMIIVDVFYLLFLIIGLFGAYQYRVNYVAAVSQTLILSICTKHFFTFRTVFKSTIFSLVWIAWNLFVVCNYLNVGFLDKVFGEYFYETTFEKVLKNFSFSIIL